LSGRYVYGKRVDYPHMIQDDKRVWESFMNEYPDRFESVDYDFRVGTGAEIPDGTESNYSRMITMLSQKRIDAIGWVGDHPTIIEVKGRAALGTIGQIIGYKMLFEQAFKKIEKPEVLIICENVSRDDLAVITNQNIPLVII